jgi:hypothetical protein
MPCAGADWAGAGAKGLGIARLGVPPAVNATNAATKATTVPPAMTHRSGPIRWGLGVLASPSFMLGSL